MTFSQDGNKNCAPNFSGRNELVPRYHLNSRRAGHSKLCNGSEPSGLTASAWLLRGDNLPKTTGAYTIRALSGRFTGQKLLFFAFIR